MRIDGEIDLINPSVSSCRAAGLCVNREAAGPLPGFAGSRRPEEQLCLSVGLARWWRGKAGAPSGPAAFLQDLAATLSAAAEPPSSALFSGGASSVSTGAGAPPKQERMSCWLSLVARVPLYGSWRFPVTLVHDTVFPVWQIYLKPASPTLTVGPLFCVGLPLVAPVGGPYPSTMNATMRA